MRADLNFLHINASDIRWGASIESFRLHKALLESGYGSHTLCGLKEYCGDDTSSIVPGKYGYIPNAFFGKAFNALGLQSFGYPSTFFLKRSPYVNGWADVIVLRNLHWWYFSIGVLPWLAKTAPLIWRFPDMWALTGHCAYSYNCQRWKTGCGHCPDLFQYPKLFFDNTHFLWKRKQRIYQSLKGRLVFVSPSKWLKELIEESPLAKDFRCEHIPTAVDMSVFQPRSKEISRQSLGIRNDEKVIMFSAFKIEDKRKGMKDMVDVIVALQKIIGFCLTILIVGNQIEKINFPSEIKVINSGFIKDENFLSKCYSASDVYLSMSKADNLPNTLVEAAACGLSIVTLDSGGCNEVLEDGKSGYVVKDSKQALGALKDILENSDKQHLFSKNARIFAESNFSMKAQVEAYVSLARSITDV